MDYKNSYTKEEVMELYEWFDTHDYPTEMDLGHGVYVKDTKLLIEKSRAVAQKKHNNPTYSGQINLLFQLREKIIQNG